LKKKVDTIYFTPHSWTWISKQQPKLNIEDDCLLVMNQTDTIQFWLGLTQGVLSCHQMITEHQINKWCSLPRNWGHIPFCTAHQMCLMNIPVIQSPRPNTGGCWKGNFKHKMEMSLNSWSNHHLCWVITFFSFKKIFPFMSIFNYLHLTSSFIPFNYNKWKANIPMLFDLKFECYIMFNKNVWSCSEDLHVSSWEELSYLLPLICFCNTEEDTNQHSSIIFQHPVALVSSMCVCVCMSPSQVQLYFR
jgi:hypothetical protein